MNAMTTDTWPAGLAEPPYEPPEPLKGHGMSARARIIAYTVMKAGGWKLQAIETNNGGDWAFGGVERRRFNRLVKGRYGPVGRDEFKALAERAAKRGEHWLRRAVREAHAAEYVQPFEGVCEALRWMSAEFAVDAGPAKAAEALNDALGLERGATPEEAAEAATNLCRGRMGAVIVHQLLANQTAWWLRRAAVAAKKGDAGQAARLAELRVGSLHRAAGDAHAAVPGEESGRRR